MIISRRGLLSGIKVALFGGFGWFISRGHRDRQRDMLHTSFAALGAQVVDPVLSAELERLGKRVYSEEGIPMFLACENVTANQTVPEAAPVPPTELNKRVAPAFRRYADEWQRLRPDAPAPDVSKIVEFLADRDFTSGGTGKTL